MISSCENPIEKDIMLIWLIFQLPLLKMENKGLKELFFIVIEKEEIENRDKII